MRILVTNDDGIYSPGITALANIASQFGEVRIVAPDVEQSAKGHAITISRPLHYYPTDVGNFESYRVDGTPADCVALGCYHGDKVDVVLSGINLGLNLGNNIWHSGTVAAAKQAALLNVPAIAFSAPYTGKTPNYDLMRPYLEQVLSMLLRGEALRTTPLVNVNLPNAPQGIRWTRQSVRHYEGNIVPGEDPRGRPLYWFSEKPLKNADEGTDRWAVEQGFVSLTPLRLDLTDEQSLQRLTAAELSS